MMVDTSIFDLLTLKGYWLTVKLKFMFQYHDPEKEKKQFFDRSPKFWDRVVTTLFISGISIVLFTLVFKWLGYFG